VSLSGRQAAHVLRLLSLARRRDLALRPAVEAAADLDGLGQARHFAASLSAVAEEDLLARLGEALARGPDAPAAAMLAALERSGLPADGLEHIAVWLAARAEHRHRLFRAVVYPFTLMITGALVYSVAFHGFAMPVLMEQFGALFESLGARLPLLSRVFVNAYRPLTGAFSSAVPAVIYVALVLAICAALLRLGLRFTGSSLALVVPYARQYLRWSAARAFADTLGVLLANGVPTDEAVPLATSAVENRSLRRDLAGLAGRVRAGEGLGEGLREARALPPTVRWRLWSAYYRSTFSEELAAVARSAAAELEVWELRVLGSMKVIVGGVAVVVLSPVILAVIAMYLPLFSLISQIG
jgi:type II secretory pathway component PulF